MTTTRNKPSKFFFGAPVYDERIIIRHEGGIMHKEQHCTSLPSAVILHTLSAYDFTHSFCISDYTEVHNLVVWCWENEISKGEVTELLGDWECSHGPHDEHMWVHAFIDSLGWPY